MTLEKTIVESTAPGKVILFGEHAVVYGIPAIACAIDKRSSCQITSDPHLGDQFALELINYNQIFHLGLDFEEGGELESFRGVTQFIQYFHEQFHLPLSGVKISLNSELPPAMGLGSSASILAALAGALNSFFDLGLNLSELNMNIFAGEKIYHQTPSGIDNSLCVYGGIQCFHEGHLSVLKMPDIGDLVVINSGIPRQTGKMVKRVREYKQEHPFDFQRIMDSIKAIVISAKSALNAGARGAFGRAMFENHRFLQELTVSHPRLDHIVDLCKREDALGAKLTGGGGGGCAIALCDPSRTKSLVETLREEGFTSFRTRVADQGLLGGIPHE